MKNFIALVLIAAVEVMFVGLGFWQLDRLAERRARNREIQAALDRPVLVVEGAIQKDWRYRRVSITGEWLREESMILRSRAYQGVPGVHLLVPLQLDDPPQLLIVNLGWIPFERQESGERIRFIPRGTVTLEGALLPGSDAPPWPLPPDPTPSPGAFNEAWRAIRLDLMAAQFEQPLAPLYLELSTPVEPGHPP